MLTSKTLLAAASAAVALVAVSAAPAQAELAYGLVNGPAPQQLVTFDTDGRTVLSSVALSGSLRSIDVRPATGELFGYDSAARQLFNVNPTTGALTAVGIPLPVASITGGAIDFNPTVDRIRLVGDENAGAGSGINFRINPDTGERIQDGSLAFASGDANAGKRADVISITYANNVATATTTTLYDLERDLDALLTQIPANDGTLQTVGGTGFDVTGFVGFDISGATGTAFVSQATSGNPFLGTVPSASTLYTIDLATGATTSLGTLSGLPDGRVLQDFTLIAAVPEPTSLGLLGLGATALLGRRRRTA